MSHEFSPAHRANVSLLIALAGASGSGKTMSALRLAQGIAAGGRIAMIDTEACRGLHYAPRPGDKADNVTTFDFVHCDMEPPFRPARFADLAQTAADFAEVVIFDSFSAEWEGIGGLQDWAHEIKDEFFRIVKKGPQGHHRMMEKFLQLRKTLIFCLKAEEKVEIKKIWDEKKQRDIATPVPIGWVPICEKRFMYDMTCSFTLLPGRGLQGRPQFDLPHKLEEWHRPFFPEGKFIDQRAGEQLAAWAKGDVDTEHPHHRLHTLITSGHAMADHGMARLQEFWHGLTREEKHEIGIAQLDSWKRTATDADNKPTHEEQNGTNVEA